MSAGTVSKKKALNSHTILLVVTIILFIVLYAGGCIAYGNKGFTHLQTFLNILITKLGGFLPSLDGLASLMKSENV